MSVTMFKALAMTSEEEAKDRLKVALGVTGSVDAAAKALKISRRSLYRYASAWGIDTARVIADGRLFAEASDASKQA